MAQEEVVSLVERSNKKNKTIRSRASDARSRLTAQSCDHEFALNVAHIPLARNASASE